jgi:hypothetical protein
MMTNKMSTAVSLDAVEKRFQQWRDGPEGRERIPDELWSAAAAAARVHGLHSTARRLHLEYRKLKGFTGGFTGSPALPRRKTSPAVKTVGRTVRQFVELTSASIGQPRCTVELHNTAGATLRIELQGGDLSALSGITHAFMGVA